MNPVKKLPSYRYTFKTNSTETVLLFVLNVMHRIGKRLIMRLDIDRQPDNSYIVKVWTRDGRSWIIDHGQLHPVYVYRNAKWWDRVRIRIRLFFAKREGSDL